MMQIMNLLTDKPGWDRKLFDDDILAKWRSEALSQQSSVLSDRCVDRVRCHIFQAAQLPLCKIGFFIPFALVINDVFPTLVLRRAQIRSDSI
jgi:Protein of unknown function (DUF4246)